MVASGSVAEELCGVNCQHSQCSQKRLHQDWQMRERLTRMPVWDGGLLLSNSDGGEICSWLSQPLKMAGYRILSRAANAVSRREPQSCHVSSALIRAPCRFCLSVNGRVVDLMAFLEAGEADVRSSGTHQRNLQVQMQRKCARSGLRRRRRKTRNDCLNLPCAAL
jgi:hypothetical protein